MQDPINLKQQKQRTKETEESEETEELEEIVNNLSPKPKGKRHFKIYSKLSAVIVLGAIGVAIYFYFQTVKSSDPQKITQQEIERMVSRVGALIILPEGEQPTIATVTDKEKLKDQSFFANAKNGDKVLIYTGARKAILYSPTQNKIIEVAPLNIGNQ